MKTSLIFIHSPGFMTVMLKSVEFLKDPKLFDPNNPIKPHNY